MGFTGGYNLADEYFNITHPYGLWKDTGVRMEGDAVRILQSCFLKCGNAIKKTDTDYTAYFPEITYTAKQTGYVQPYADNPLDDEHTGENVYMNVLNSAREYAYFITPYLLISDEMKKALLWQPEEAWMCGLSHRAYRTKSLFIRQHVLITTDW